MSKILMTLQKTSPIISAVEYRIALALGATVGVVEESGREVAKLL